MHLRSRVSMAQLIVPPVDGSLPTLLDFVDFNHQHNADKPFFIFPSAANPTKLTSVSHAEMAEASHRIAHILRPDRRGPDGEVVGLVLHTDTVLYVAVILGVLRAGLVVRTALLLLAC